MGPEATLRTGAGIARRFDGIDPDDRTCDLIETTENESPVNRSTFPQAPSRVSRKGRAWSRRHVNGSRGHAQLRTPAVATGLQQLAWGGAAEVIWENCKQKALGSDAEALA